jgi:hypothetical protein
VQTVILSVVTPSRHVGGYNGQTIHSSKTLATRTLHTQSHNRGSHIPHFDHCENLKSHILYNVISKYQNPNIWIMNSIIVLTVPGWLHTPVSLYFLRKLIWTILLEKIDVHILSPVFPRCSHSFTTHVRVCFMNLQLSKSSLEVSETLALKLPGPKIKEY